MFRRIRKLFISPKSDDTGPTVRAQYFIRLDTYKAVRPHPLDLSSEGGEAVEVAWLMGKIYRHDVGLIVQRTRQPAESDTSEEYITLPAASSGRLSCRTVFHGARWGPTLRIPKCNKFWL